MKELILLRFKLFQTLPKRAEFSKYKIYPACTGV